MDDRGMTRRTLIMPLVVAASLAGCGGSSDDGTRNKAGAPAPSKAQSLDVQATDAGSPEAQYFARQIEQRSAGTLTVKLHEDYPATEPANEARLARDLLAGKADFGVLPARAWAPAGVRAFDALQAPFVLGDYDVARAALAGRAGTAMKRALENAGVTALGLVPAELRRVLSVRPLATPDAFRGMSIRIPDNDTSAAALRSLGARPIEGITADEVLGQLRAHVLTGAETAPIWAVANGYGKYAQHITGYALFDRVDTLVASPSAWERLSSSQQAAVRDAVKDAIGYAGSLSDRETGSLATLCRSGVRVTTPTAAQLSALVDATEPVRAALRGDPATAAVMHELEATDGAGPRALEVPSECAKPAPADVEAKAGPATIPEGTYKVRTTVADFERWGQYGPDWEQPIVWTIILRDGRFWFSQSNDPPGAEPASGTFTVNGDVTRFRILEPAVDANPPWTARWSFYKGELTWVPIDIADLGERIVWGAHPWKKVG
jgi:TRAP-type C4-dicarboxylate transport system substrate-binding protein